MRKGKIRLALFTRLHPGAAFCQETSSGWWKTSSYVSQRKKIKPKLYLGRQWHSRVKESHETTWLGGERNKIFCVQGVLGITPRSLGFTIGPRAPKTEMQIALHISLGRVSTNMQNQSWRHREQMAISCLSHAWVSRVPFTWTPTKRDTGTCICTRALCSGIWISFHLVVMSGTWQVDCKWLSLQLPSISRILYMQSLTYAHWAKDNIYIFS